MQRSLFFVTYAVYLTIILIACLNLGEFKVLSHFWHVVHEVLLNVEPQNVGIGFVLRQQLVVRCLFHRYKDESNPTLP
jgi:hypothetical protein